MALTCDISFRGLTVSGAYVTVNMPRILVDKETLSFGVIFKADASAEEELYSEQYECAYDISGENPFSQAYAYLKTLDQFSGATDTDE
ncbi:hypothetical protein [Klebsiella indica]|uniref:hypothetical protein n=1 Tax=Klebsiella indica TaxID=2582917 RepID=UPI0031B6E879